MAKKKTVKDLELELAEVRSSLETQTVRAGNLEYDLKRWRTALIEVAKQLDLNAPFDDCSNVSVVAAYVEDALTDLKQDLVDAKQNLQKRKRSSKAEIKGLRKTILRAIRSER